MDACTEHVLACIHKCIERGVAPFTVHVRSSGSFVFRVITGPRWHRKLALGGGAWKALPELLGWVSVLLLLVGSHSGLEPARLGAAAGLSKRTHKHATVRRRQRRRTAVHDKMKYDSHLTGQSGASSNFIFQTTRCTAIGATRGASA